MLYGRCLGAVEAAPGSRDVPYVYRVVRDAGSTSVAASTSHHVMKLYAVTGAGLTQSQQLDGHSENITDISFSPDSASVLLSSSQDGTIRSWDTRAGRQTAE